MDSVGDLEGDIFWGGGGCNILLDNFNKKEIISVDMESKPPLLGGKNATLAHVLENVVSAPETLSLFSNSLNL